MLVLRLTKTWNTSTQFICWVEYMLGKVKDLKHWRSKYNFYFTGFYNYHIFWTHSKYNIQNFYQKGKTQVNRIKRDGTRRSEQNLNWDFEVFNGEWVISVLVEKGCPINKSKFNYSHWKVAVMCSEWFCLVRLKQHSDKKGRHKFKTRLIKNGYKNIRM